MQRCHTYKLQSRNIFKESTGGRGSKLEGSGWMCMKNKRVDGGRVRIDVNEELKFL